MTPPPDNPDPRDPDLDPITGLVTGKFNRNPPGIGFWALVREDLETHENDLLSQGFWALFWHRFGNWRMSVRPQLLRAPLTLVYRVMFKVTEWLCGISLPYTSLVGRRVRLEHFGCMILAHRSIGSDVVLRQNTTFGIARTDDLASRPVIGDHVDIGVGVVIIGGVTVGRGAIIGANSVVTRSVPAYAVVVGAPARVLRMRDPAAVGDPPLPGGVAGPSIVPVPRPHMKLANDHLPDAGDDASAGQGDGPHPITGAVATR